jgi:hypothetical protein
MMAARADGNPFPLSAKLIGLAFEHLQGSAPTVVWTKPTDVPEELEPDTIRPPYSWPLRIPDSSADLPPVVAEELARGPVFLIPPWNRLTERRGDLHIRDAYEATLLDCAAPGADALLGVLTPSVLWTSAREGVRRELAARWKPVLIIYFQGASQTWPAIHPSFQLSAAFLRPADATEESVLRIFEVPRQSPDEVIVEDLQKLLKRGGGQTEFGYVLRDLPPAGASLAYGRHDPRMAAKRSELSVLGSSVAIGEIFDRVPGGIDIVDDSKLLLSDYRPGAVRVIHGRHLGRGGVLAPAGEPGELTRSKVPEWSQVPAGRQLRAGDILLPEITRPTDRGGLAAVELTEADLPATAVRTVVALRPKKQLTFSERIIILGYLRSRLARTLAAASGDWNVHLTWTTLKELHIPRPDEALSAALGDLDEAARRFQQWQSEAQGLLESVFADDSPTKTRDRIVRDGRIVRLRSGAAAELDDEGYIFRTRMPFPVAHRWREAEAELSAGAGERALKAILDAAEVLLCHSALVGLAIARGSDIEIGYLKRLRNRLLPGEPGLGFGDWTAALEEFRDSRKTLNAPDDSPVKDFRAFLAATGAADAVTRIGKWRNRGAHLKGADLLEFPAAVEACMQDLKTLYRAAGFLSDLPLLYVTDFRWDSFRKVGTVSYRELIGDHPVTPTRTLEYRDYGIEKESLYVMDGQRRLYLLRPFLSGRYCPQCGNWSTVHVDGRAKEDDMLQYMPLEHGHTFPDLLLDDGFRFIGLLDLSVKPSRPAQSGTLATTRSSARRNWPCRTTQMSRAQRR